MMRKPRGVRATKDGLQKLMRVKAAKRDDNQPWTYERIAAAAGVDVKTVKRFFKGVGVDRDSAWAIAEKALELPVIEVVDPNEWNPAPAPELTPLNGAGAHPGLGDEPTTETTDSEGCSGNAAAEEPQSSSQTSQQNGPEPNSQSSTDDLPNLMDFIKEFTKPGVPLLLSLGVIGSLFALSWLVNWYGVEKYQTGQVPIAQFAFRVAFKLIPWSPAAHYNQGVIYEDQHNYQRAHDEYQLAIEGGLIEAYNNQARLYILQGNHDAAVSLLQIGLPLAKDDRVRSDFYKNRGWARLEQNRYEEAKVDLQEAIKLESNRAPAYCLLAQVLEREGDKQGALAKWKNCLELAYRPTPEEDRWIHLARQRLNTRGGQQ